MRTYKRQFGAHKYADYTESFLEQILHDVKHRKLTLHQAAAKDGIMVSIKVKYFNPFVTVDAIWRHHVWLIASFYICIHCINKWYSDEEQSISDKLS